MTPTSKKSISDEKGLLTMNDIRTSTEQLRLLYFMSGFGETHVEDLFPKGLVKYGLNKLRWVLTDFGISHFYLPEMPIADYIMIAASLDEQITSEDNLSTTVFYRVIAARNILDLLSRAYEYNDSVKNFYDTSVGIVLEAIRNDNLFQYPDGEKLLRTFSLSSQDSIKRVTDVLLESLEPILKLGGSKISIFKKLISGSEEEQKIINAYELYHLLFPIFFSLQLPADYSAESLNPKYRTRRIQDGYNDQHINVVHSWKERKVTK